MSGRRSILISAVVVAVVIVVTEASRQERQASVCGSGESCTLLRSCRTFQDLLRNPTRETIRKVMASVCNNNRSNLKVCCPESSEPTPITPTPEPSVTPIVVPGSGEGLLPRFCNTVISPSENGVRIISGENVTVDDPLPWMALLGYDSTTAPVWACGGALITEQYVLTAAHCVHLDHTYGSQLKVVRLGEINLETATDCKSSLAEVCAPQPQDFTPAQVIMHPDFDTRVTVSDDIALIRLDRKPNLNSYVQPACLPPAGANMDSVLGGQQGMVAGWGLTETNGKRSQILQKALVPFVDKATCTPHFVNEIVPEQICFGGGAQDSCRGDSGGPVVMTDFQTSHQLVIGIVSRGKDRKCGTEGVPGLYTYVASYRNWITGHLRP